MGGWHYRFPGYWWHDDLDDAPWWAVALGGLVGLLLVAGLIVLLAVIARHPADDDCSTFRLDDGRTITVCSGR